MLRTVTPELLDSLPPDSPEAGQSRRDLVWFNRLLGTNRWWAQTLPRLQSQLGSHAGLEVGAGDGQLARRFHLDALDLCPAPVSWPATSRWHQNDALQFNAWSDYRLIVANLFLHHLLPDQLAQLGRIWDQTAHTLVICEPWRARAFQPGFALLCSLIRAHAVSRHDGHVSIAAGFKGHELPALLGLTQDRWTFDISHHPLGTYRMIARRKERT
jgi:hypothetical protein